MFVMKMVLSLETQYLRFHFSINEHPFIEKMLLKRIDFWTKWKIQFRTNIPINKVTFNKWNFDSSRIYSVSDKQFILEYCQKIAIIWN